MRIDQWCEEYCTKVNNVSSCKEKSSVNSYTIKKKNINYFSVSDFGRWEENGEKVYPKRKIEMVKSFSKKKRGISKAVGRKNSPKAKNALKKIAQLNCMNKYLLYLIKLFNLKTSTHHISLYSLKLQHFLSLLHLEFRISQISTLIDEKKKWEKEKNVFKLICSL